MLKNNGIDGSFVGKLSLSAKTDGKSFSGAAQKSSGTIRLKLDNGMLVKLAGSDKTITEAGAPGGTVGLEQRGKFSATYALDSKTFSGNIEQKTTVLEKDVILKLGYNESRGKDGKESQTYVDTTVLLNKSNEANIKYNLKTKAASVKYSFRNNDYVVEPSAQIKPDKPNFYSISVAKKLEDQRLTFSYDSGKTASVEFGVGKSSRQTLFKKPFAIVIKSQIPSTKGFAANLSCTCERTWDL